MIILGIETSCDEASVAILKDDRTLVNVISSQWVHEKFGGVVPELASRAHLRMLPKILDAAIQKSGLQLGDMDAIAVTAGPGLIGAVLVGLNFAKGLAIQQNIPFVGVNHMEGHIYANFLDGQTPQLPLLAIVVSGGHTQLVIMRDHGDYKIIGKTRDDAIGEAYDKTAKVLGLGYPGGPEIDKRAATGDESFLTLPIGRIKDNPFDFSYSGLKTAVMQAVRKLNDKERAARMNDICASFQKAATEAVLTRAKKAMEKYQLKNVVLAGGVAANSRLRNELLQLGNDHGWQVGIPKMAYCMDNAAMIARAGLEALNTNQFSSLRQNAWASKSMEESIVEQT